MVANVITWVVLVSLWSCRLGQVLVESVDRCFQLLLRDVYSEVVRPEVPEIRGLVRGLPWSPLVSRGLPWSPVASRGLPWSPVVSRGLPWPPVASRGQ